MKTVAKKPQKRTVSKVTKWTLRTFTILKIFYAFFLSGRNELPYDQLNNKIKTVVVKMLRNSKDILFKKT